MKSQKFKLYSAVALVAISVMSCSKEAPSDEQSMREFNFAVHEPKVIEVNVVDEQGQPVSAPVLVTDHGKIVSYGVSESNGRFTQQISWNAGMDLKIYAGNSEPKDLRLQGGPQQVTASANAAAAYKGMTSVDTDGDGVVDSLDVDPNDPRFVSFTSADGRFLFEDNFPYQGDYDFNDVVVDYQVMAYLDNMGDVRKAVYMITPLFSGAGDPNSLHIKLATIANGDLSNVADSSGYGNAITKSANVAQWELADEFNSLNGLGIINSWTSTFTWEQRIWNARKGSYDTPWGTQYVGGWSDGRITHISSTTTYGYQHWAVDTTAGAPTVMVLSFELPSGYTLADLTGDNLDIFIKNQAGKEIHKKSVNSVYQNPDGMPFALDVPNTVDWPNEMVRIDSVYPNFPAWATSNGTVNQNWWE